MAIPAVTSGHDQCQLSNTLMIGLIIKTNLKKICPGIRAIDATKTDQLRTAPADKAIEDGADLLVMGRSFFWAQY